MISDDLVQTVHILDTNVMVDVVRMDSDSSFNDFQLTDQMSNVTPSNNILENNHQRYQEKSSHCYFDATSVEMSNIENDSNQFTRPKRNLLIDSKRPKSQYDSSTIQSKSKQIAQRSQQKSAKRKEHICTNCNKKFTRSSHLTRHLTTTSCTNQNNTPQFMCEICGKFYNRKDNLQEHLRTHNGEVVVRDKNHKCKFCEKSFHGLSMLQIHERVHTGERPYKCEFCDKRMISQGALNKHKRVHTREKPYKCCECEMSFSLKGTLTRHMYTHNTKPKPHVCKYCDKEFIQLSGLRAHLFHHTGENGFKCEICDKVFSRLDRLQMHTKYLHQNNRSFNCDKCNKKFVRKDDLQKHLSTHQGSNRKSECKLCKLSFTLEESLKIHELTHNKPSPIKCNFCDRNFLNRDFMNKHISAHHNETSPIPSTSRAIKLALDLDVDLDSNDESSMNSTSTNNSDEICMRDEEFVETLEKLLRILVDEITLQKIEGWPNLSSRDILKFLVRQSGHEPIVNNELDECDQLRANLNLFFTFIEDETFKRLLNNHSIDEVLVYLIK